MTNKPISAGRTNTGAYVEENRKLDAGFRVKGFSRIRGNECARADGTVTDHSGGSRCNCVSKAEFAGDGCFESIFGVGAVKTRHLRETSRRGGKGKYSAEAIKTTVRAEYRVRRLVRKPYWIF